LAIPRGGDVDPDVVFAINMTVLCQEMHCLPGRGGLLDQDGLYVYMMEAVLEGQNERRKLEERRSASGSQRT
jgi:hypothetical protein